MISKRLSKVLMLGIFIYVVFHVFTFFIGKETETIAVELEKMELKIKQKGLVIKDEQIIYANKSGLVKNLYKENEKVKKNEEVSFIYGDINIDKITSQIKDLDEKIKVVKESIPKQKSSASKHIKSNQLENLKNQKEILNEKLEENKSLVKGEISGVVSYNIDGYEEKYSVENIQDITKEDIENASNNYKNINKDNENIKEKDPLLKLVNPNDVYIAICIDDKYSKDFQLGKEIKVRFKKEIIDSKVDKVYKNNGEVMIILKISNQNIGIYDTRVEEFDIIYKHIEGFKLPKKSVKEVNNKKGVYILNQQTKQVEFVDLKEVAYEDKENIFVKNDSANSNDEEKTIALHDEVILSPNLINKNIKIK